ncbi:hypothetical protein F0562_021975 [Nyssa sinensis]|uniref:Uncharacterized protein n=1 Tax=Nyssa sinensis TaxID=561372 RepID=A0A5J5BMA9_9ASTE|nr:hypothetical protein F0562_021975 [Nyssa sinensis]
MIASARSETNPDRYTSINDTMRKIPSRFGGVFPCCQQWWRELAVEGREEERRKEGKMKEGWRQRELEAEGGARRREVLREGHEAQKEGKEKEVQRVRGRGRGRREKGRK